ncbi:MAG: 16S rRNA (cytosine(967)-C(5))-methyltransferase RsmB [Clostridia bacterium]|nr:16S rRNA (cytosine(967)-C(5))-methyltransferase RsmB [Clostridia bacterium]
MRYTALKILENILNNGKYSNLELAGGMENLSDKDKALATNIVYGVLQNKSRLDHIISAYSKIPLKKVSSDVLNILRMGVYQALFMDKIPAYAITNESIKMVKKCKKTSASGFVNAVLRGVMRDDKKVEYPSDRLEYLSIYYSCPLWICKMWDKMFPGKLEEILASMNEKPDFTVRVNTLKMSVEEFISQRGGEKSPLCEDVVILPSGANLKNDELFKKGCYYPQDSASAMVSVLLDPQKGQTVMDLCAAPGGKTTHIAQLMQNDGKIIAFDIHEHKLDIINETARRLGIDIISAEQADAGVLQEKYVGMADRVLVDAPCSGLGILRRKPEIKYTKNESDMKELAKIQLKILSVAAQYLKPGGVMVYSTCTVSDVENNAVTQAFLEENKNFKLDAEPTQILPCDGGADGFYMAKFIKTR